MDLLHSSCAGLDVHKDTVVACSRVAVGGRVDACVRTFATTTRELLALSDWLIERGCTLVGMEATGVYWKPVWHVLEGAFELVLANAQHVRNVPGRKTDVNDAQWLADLVAHGLVRSSFVPPEPVQEMRELTRARKQLVREAGQHVQRIQKTLEDANIKLTGTISDVLGKGGRAIVEALIAGHTDPRYLATLAPRVKAAPEQLAEALRGTVRPHHQFLLQLHLGQFDAAQAAIASIDERLGGVMEPFRVAAERLTTIPGVRDTTANIIVAEIGIDMSRFPSQRHLVSWAGLCPRNDESAGKRRSTRLRHGDPWLKTALVQAAWAAARTKGTYFHAQFLRIKSRRGVKKAVVAVAASMLTAIYFMLRDGADYRDLGPNYFETRNTDKTARRLIKRLTDLGFRVAIQSPA